MLFSHHKPMQLCKCMQRVQRCCDRQLLDPLLNDFEEEEEEEEEEEKEEEEEENEEEEEEEQVEEEEEEEEEDKEEGYASTIMYKHAVYYRPRLIVKLVEPAQGTVEVLTLDVAFPITTLVKWMYIISFAYTVNLHVLHVSSRSFIVSL